VLNLYDILYGAGLALSAPFWLAKGSARRKVLKAISQRMGHVTAAVKGNGPTVMIHAVSLGEINATPALVRGLAAARADLRFVISTTTDTGYSRAQDLFGSDARVSLIRYPLDFTAAVRRVLDTFQPSVVVLMELEVWPNFALQCERSGIPVVLVNGRLTAGSFRNYRLGGPLVRRMFRRLRAVCAQEQTYAERFIALGAPPDRVQVTGTMKFDTAQVAAAIPGAEELAAVVGLHPGNDRVWVCGSTGPGEEAILLRVYRELLKSNPRLRLVLVPRKPERFDEVAQTITLAGFGVIRRSQSSIANCKLQIANSDVVGPVILGDTMGELRKFYSLADVIFVGRTLVDLGSRQHGSDMIEPAGLAKPTIVGPFTGNFAEVMNQFRASNAIREITTAEELANMLITLLSDQAAAKAMGARAQDVVRTSQGATARHLAIILDELNRALNRPEASAV
jgi:3-deoxy-D-manno-octulosonic-acid transferase